jgi:hypothetical protein
MVEPVEGSGVSVPLRGAAVGLLVGIVLTFFLGVETAGGTALLIVISMLAVTIIWWIVDAVLRRGPRP